MIRAAYRPQLDTLRALAVSSVVVSHLLTPLVIDHHGVRLFFVISGFLITGILLRQRESEHDTFWHKIRVFYFRRAVRIWPIYYLVVLGAALINLNGFRESLPWHLGYVSNFYFMWKGEFIPSSAGHLWSLSVEEQFYLFWPFAILLIAEHRLLWLVAGSIAAAVGYRWAAIVSGLPLPDISTPAAFDAFGVGAALAIARHSEAPREILRCFLWPASALAVVALLALSFSGSTKLEFALSDLFYAVIFATMIFEADCGINGRPKSVLEWPPFLYIGKISYGIYLYHMFIAYLVWAVSMRLDFEVPRHSPQMFLIAASLTVIVATVSWFAIEKPLGEWKQKFSYTAAKRQQVSW